MELPDKFISVMKDFVSDLKNTFPEHAHKWWVYGEETSEDGWKDLFQYCLKVYPERFFDILYQNEDIFKLEGESNVDFIPRVDFKALYFCEGISVNTQQTIWKYLQLILFMVVGSVKDKSEFGNTMNLFEGVNEEELQQKMADAMSGLDDFFKHIDKNKGDTEDTEDTENTEKSGEKEFEKMKGLFEHFTKNMGESIPFDPASLCGDPEKMKEAFGQFSQAMGMDEMMGENDGEDNPEKMKEAFDAFMKSMDEKTSNGEETNESSQNMPNPDDLHSHLKGLFGGKLGSLAQELMEELTEDVQESLGLNPDDLENNSNPMDVLKKLMRHPDKLMKLVKRIQNKFQDKMSSGDLSQEDLMKEAGDMLKKMKEMGGNSKQMNEMFQNMAKSMGGGSMGKNMKVDTNRIDRMLKTESTKDRLRAKLEKKKQDNFVLEKTTQENNFVYRPIDGEKAEKTVMTNEDIDRIANEIGDITNASSNNKSKKSNKKKKNKK